MTRLDPVEPTVDAHGDEQHPSWGMIGASRVSGHATLFDSDIRHQHFVTLRISTGRRSRDLNRDWLRPADEFVEVAMSEAQWASFVSSMNAGQGVPCTILRRDREQVPPAPFTPRLRESMGDVERAAANAAEAVAKAFATFSEKRTAANLRSLEFAIKNMPANIVFAASSLTEHAENVVQRARADIEAMVVAKAQQLGLSEADLGSFPLLSAGDDT